MRKHWLARSFEDGSQENELLGSWRAEPQCGWVHVESVVDSGASAPVAPPSVCLSVPECAGTSISQARAKVHECIEP